MASDAVNIVADIGGTNLRIGMLDQTGSIKNLHLYQCAEFSGLQTVLEDYFVQHQIDSSQVNACLAIACPVDKDLISMTNLPWEFKQSELKASLKLRSLYMINDYTAIAMSINSLDDSQKVKIGKGEPVAHKPIAICGPGTGLGVANLFEYQGQWISVGGEGGHVDFAPTDDTEVAILNFLKKKYSRVSAEQLLSGLGIEQIYQALCELHNVEPQPYKAKDISAKGITKDCDICHQAMQQFCKTLGSFAGNLALTTGAFGGVYIAGGIVPRFLEFFANSDFRTRFEAKGRFEGFNQAIPTYVITEPQPGISGASAFLTQQINNEVVCL
ncbi:glucokinase [Thalassotalea litorea]|uniref:glucokinase n=1 Tax=Thalassotalea litorea TaxID=2020715 RepID=UPI0037355CEB